MAIALVGTAPLTAASLTLKDGRTLDGDVALLSELASNPLNATTQGQPGSTPILMLDNGLYRIYVNRQSQVAAVNEMAGQKYAKFNIRQRVAETGLRIGHVGDVVGIGPWDEFGRRIFSMTSERGQLDIVQGITEITPQWIRVQGLMGKQAFVWDYRMATSSMPMETLKKIMLRQIDPKNREDRVRLVRLLLEAERFNDAQTELEGVIRDFPSEAALQAVVRDLMQKNARRIIDEIKLRRRVGQFRFAYMLLQNFPREGVAGEILQQVRELLAEFDKTRDDGLAMIEELKGHVAAIRDEALHAPGTSGNGRIAGGVESQHDRPHGRLSAIERRREAVARR